MDTIRFLNLSPEKSKGLDSIIFKNAQRLRKDAKTLIRVRESYSTAVPLLVLSAEEAVKAFLILLHSQGYKVYQLDSARKFFSDHIIRHKIAMMLEAAMFMIDIDAIIKEKKIEGTTIRVFRELFYTWERIDILKLFNEYKNKGFYVDYIDGLKVPKYQIEEEDYLRVDGMNYRILYIYKLTRLLFNPQLKWYIPEDFINNVQDKVKTNIDELLNNDFTFGMMDENE